MRRNEGAHLSNIPRGRRLTKKIAVELSLHPAMQDVARQLHWIAENTMVRRRPTRRAPPKSKPITPALTERVIELAQDLHLQQVEIAHEVGTNPGRISEILQRFPPGEHPVGENEVEIKPRNK
jgi:signal recognition particle subunit SEC65